MVSQATGTPTHFLLSSAESEALDSKNMGPKLKRAEPDPLVAAHKPQGIDLLILWDLQMEMWQLCPRENRWCADGSNSLLITLWQIGRQLLWISIRFLLTEFLFDSRIDDVSTYTCLVRRVKAASLALDHEIRVPTQERKEWQMSCKKKGSKERNGFDRLPDIAEKVSDSARSLRSLQQRKKKIFFSVDWAK